MREDTFRRFVLLVPAYHFECILYYAAQRAVDIHPLVNGVLGAALAGCGVIAEVRRRASRIDEPGPPE